MAEEHRFQPPRPCVNNCGFFGSPATQDLCSKCYRDLQMKQQQSSNAKIALSQTLGSTATATSSSSSSPSLSISPPPPDSVPVPVPVPSLSGSKVEPVQTPAPAASQANRCSTCRRRVGLTGFKCRCGFTYCGSHRYPEQHACGFDFKGMGRDQISKANPLIKAPKLDKI